MNLSIEVVRTFVAVAETGSLSRVAAQLQVSQPAVTLQMRRLESAVGAPLLIKGLGGTSLTELGKSALAPARQAIDAFDQLLALRAGSIEERPIRLGISALLLPELLKGDFALKHSDVILISDHSREISRGLTEGLIDVGCGFASNSGFAKLDTWVLERHSIHLSWARSKAFRPRPGAKIPVVGLPDDNFMTDPMKRRGIEFKFVLQTADLHAKFEAVRAGLGVCVAPTRLIPADLVIASEAYLPALEQLDACICCRPEFEKARRNLLMASLREVLQQLVRPDGRLMKHA